MGVRPSPRARYDRVRLVNGADVRRDRWTLSLQCMFAARSASRCRSSDWEPSAFETGA